MSPNSSNELIKAIAIESRLICGTFLVLLLLLVVQAEDGQSETGAGKSNGNVRSGFKLPEIFQFDRFKSLYDKHYSSKSEELARLRVFLARSYQVFISAVGYLYRTRSYYLKVGDSSDLLPAELEARRNRYTMSRAEVTTEDVVEVPLESAESNLNQLEPDELEAELQRIHENAETDPAYSKLASELDKLAESEHSKRRKRDLTPSAKRSDFSIEQAFSFAGKGDRSDGSGQQVSVKPASNNPNWRPPELNTTGVRSYEDESGFKDYSVWVANEGEERAYDQLPVKGRSKRLSLAAYLTQIFLNDEKRARKSSKRVAK